MDFRVHSTPMVHGGFCVSGSGFRVSSPLPVVLVSGSGLGFRVGCWLGYHVGWGWGSRTCRTL